VGSVVLADDVEIGANSTVDRGTLGDTRIGRGTKIDNLVMIAHNCQIGENVLIAAQVGIAGSSTVEHDAVLLGQVGIAGHVTIGAHAFLAAKTGVSKDVPANMAAFGYPHRVGDRWHKEQAAVRQLPRLLKRFRALERRLGGGSEDDG
jgi:UDP-3-O-[3-hydroxymyristoyl] glucosamine N-acyltransferase